MLGVSGCDLSSGSQPNVPSASAPPATPLPIQSCLLAPNNGGKDTRIEVTGPDAISGCAALLSFVGSVNWMQAGTQASGPPAFSIPSADSATICRGVIGSSAYEVLDRGFFNGFGGMTCQALKGSPYPPTS